VATEIVLRACMMLCWKQFLFFFFFFLAFIVVAARKRRPLQSV
jgi:hypothetical protein